MKWKPLLYVVLLVAIVVLLAWTLMRKKEGEPAEPGGPGPAGGRAARRAGQGMVLQYDEVSAQAEQVPFDFLTGHPLAGGGRVSSVTEGAGGVRVVKIDVDEPGGVQDGAEIEVRLRPREATGEMPAAAGLAKSEQEVTFQGKVADWEVVNGKLHATLENGVVQPAAAE